MNDSAYFDNTRVSAYKTCPRYYFIRHILHWSGVGQSYALHFGTGWHAAQDIVWGHAKTLSKGELAKFAYMAFLEKWQEAGLPTDLDLETQQRLEPRTPAIAYEMLYEYINARWRMLQESNVIAVEKPFAVPLPTLPNVWYLGKLDKTVQYNAMRLILEHKTTTAYAKNGNFRYDYLESWDMSSQVKGYTFGGNLHYGNIDQVWVDAALVHKTIHNAFKFIPVAHSFPIMEEWVAGTTQWIVDIMQETKAYEEAGELRPGMFKKNEESCYGKYGACAFIDICRAIHRPDQLSGPPGGFIESKWEPFSVLKLEGIIEENSNESI
jgi:hypothetical protein